MLKKLKLLSFLSFLVSIGCSGMLEPGTNGDDTGSIKSTSEIYEELRDGNRALQLGSVRHKLSEDQIDRVAKMAEVLREVHPLSRELWIDGFTRDEDPESEIQLWENVAEAYRIYCSDHALTSEVKSEVFTILLLCTMMPEERVLESATPQHLRVDQINDILKRISVDPKPLVLESGK